MNKLIRDSRVSLNKHEAEFIIIRGKEVIVDLNIIPLIKYLNKDMNIETIYSCEGDDEYKDGQIATPYVLLKCLTLTSFKNLLKIFRDAKKIETLEDLEDLSNRCHVRLDDDDNLIVNVNFDSKKDLLELINTLK